MIERIVWLKNEFSKNGYVVYFLFEMYSMMLILNFFVCNLNFLVRLKIFMRWLVKEEWFLLVMCVFMRSVVRNLGYFIDYLLLLVW